MSLQSILSDSSVERAWDHLQWIQENAPVRINGAGDDLRAAEYFAEQLDTYGLEAYLDQFTTYRSVPLRGDLRILTSETMDIACEACGHIVSTSDIGIEADLIFVGPGAPADYENKDVRGRIVLTDITSGPARPEKARIAVDHQAAGIIFINMGPPEHHNIPMGAIKSVWGNPTRASMAEIPQIPAIGITRADGDRLIALCGNGQVHIRMIAQASRDWGPLPQTWGRLQGGASNGDVLIVGGHFDAWEPGMSDNAAGNALILELAERIYPLRDQLKRDIIFAFWNGHEIGEIAGSTWFLDTHWDEIDERGIAYFNVDSVGFTRTSHFETASTTELIRFHQDVESLVLGGPAHRKKLTRGNEQPFIPIGLPSLEGSYRYSEQQIAAWNGASGGWWWHSTADTLDKVDPERYRQTRGIYAGYILEMCMRPILPFNYADVAENLKDRIVQVDQHYAMDLPVDAFCDAAESLMKRISDEPNPVDPDRFNHTLKRLSRILMPVFETFGGRYDQDRVAHPALSSPIPILHELQDYLDLPEEDEQRHLMDTELLRGRNQLSDTLRRATEEIHRGLA